MEIHAAQKASTVEKLNLEYQDGEWQVQVQYRDENNESAVATYQFDANDTETVIDLRDEFGLSFSIEGAAQAGDKLHYQQAKTLNGNDDFNILNVLTDVIEALRSEEHTSELQSRGH